MGDGGRGRNSIAIRRSPSPHPLSKAADFGRGSRVGESSGDAGWKREGVRERSMNRHNGLLRFWKVLAELFEEEDPPGEVRYDVMHLAGVLVICLTALGALFWLLWALLVCEGGIFTKIGPFLQVVFTERTLRDFGYEGTPYKLGVFEGWIVNVAGLAFCTAALAVLWWVFHSKEKSS